MELYLGDGALVSKESWNSIVDSLKIAAPSRLDVEKALIDAVRIRMRGGMGVFFSGGLDSTTLAFIARKLGVKFTCYTVGFMDGSSALPRDVVFARKIAHQLGFDYRERVLSLLEFESVVKSAAQALGGRANPVNVSIASVILASIELAKQDSVEYFLGGLGAEEIFAGYQRHRLASDVNAECWAGLYTMYDRDLVRDFAIAQYSQVKITTPFLDKELILAAMSLPPRSKIAGDHDKYALRMLALKLGIPQEVALRPKQAAQYGSRFDRALAILSKKKGFGSQQQYLESII